MLRFLQLNAKKLMLKFCHRKKTDLDIWKRYRSWIRKDKKYVDKS